MRPRGPEIRERMIAVGALRERTVTPVSNGPTAFRASDGPVLRLDERAHWRIKRDAARPKPDRELTFNEAVRYAN